MRLAAVRGQGVGEWRGGGTSLGYARAGRQGCATARRRALDRSSPPADDVLRPEVPLALRLSGQLLLGLVRVYLRKLQYLEHDASHALEGLRKVRLG